MVLAELTAWHLCGTIKVRKSIAAGGRKDCTLSMKYPTHDLPTQNMGKHSPSEGVYFINIPENAILIDQPITVYTKQKNQDSQVNDIDLSGADMDRDSSKEVSTKTETQAGTYVSSEPCIVEIPDKFELVTPPIARSSSNRTKSSYTTEDSSPGQDEENVAPFNEPDPSTAHLYPPHPYALAYLPQRDNIQRPGSGDSTSPEAILEETFSSLLQVADWSVSRHTLWHGNRKTKLWSAIRNVQDMARIANHHGIIAIEDRAKMLRARLLSESALQEQFRPSEKLHWVSFADEIYDVYTGELRPRQLSDRIIHCLAVSAGDCLATEPSAAFLQLIGKAAGSSEAASRLQELCGLALSAAPASTLLFLQCEHRSTGSLFLNMLDDLVSFEAVSYLSLADHDKGFATSQAIGKHLLLSFKEGEALIKNLETVLRIVDGDGITADRKFQESVDFRPCATIVCAGRFLPRVQATSIFDASDYISRVILTGCLTKGEAHKIRYTMKADFASWAVSGLQRYIKSYELTPCKGCNLENEFASLIDFWDSCVIEDPDGRHTTQEIINQYHKYCSLENKIACSKRDVLQFVREKTGQKSCPVRSRTESGKSTVRSGYRGFNFLTPVAKASDDTETTQSPDSAKDNLHYDIDDEEDDNHRFMISDFLE